MATVHKTANKRMATKTSPRSAGRRLSPSSRSERAPLNGKHNGRSVPSTNGHTDGHADGQGNGKRAAELERKAIPVQREELERERTQVLQALELLRAELQETPEATGDEVDLNVYEREKTLGLVSSYERRLGKLDMALQRAARGEYGKCQRCGQPISPERLKIFPETRHCVKCKSELEQLAKRGLA